MVKTNDQLVVDFNDRKKAINMNRQRIVMKVGSSSLTEANGALSLTKLQEHVAAIVSIKKQGHEVILVSSGAIAAGFSALGYPSRPVTVAGKQAAAAVGQGLLMQAYLAEFAKHGLTAAQLLLTREDFADQKRYQNALQTITELLKRSAVPIINENDSTSVEELTFGDNDMLSALVSGFIHADTLCMITDVNGLYDSNPNQNPNAKKYHFLPNVTDDLLMVAGQAGSKVGTGGMKSKLLAAQTALPFGVNVFIGKTSGQSTLQDLLAGKGDGTYIGSFKHESVMPSSKQWLAVHSHVNGQIKIDKGAEKALMYEGKSLLPVGITSVSGSFGPNDVVEIINEKGKVIGKGQSTLSSVDLTLIKGMSSNEASEQVKLNKAVAIHRDQWVTLAKERM
jgi:glutamate 5-kinase